MRESPQTGRLMVAIDRRQQGRADQISLDTDLASLMEIRAHDDPVEFAANLIADQLQMLLVFPIVFYDK